MEFKNILKDLRQEQNLTQKQLADKIGYSKSIIGFWESGKHEPTISALITLSNFFELSIDYLAGKNYEYDFKYESNKRTYTEEINIFSVEEKEILKYFNAMSAGQKAETRGFMRGMLVASGVNMDILNKGI